jgi:hypothetical protein
MKSPVLTSPERFLDWTGLVFFRLMYELIQLCMQNIIHVETRSEEF